jgi:hypothetical protein
VPPWRQYEALKAGTLVAVVAHINSFNYDDPGKQRKVSVVLDSCRWCLTQMFQNYQFNAVTVRILAESCSEVEARFKRLGPQHDSLTVDSTAQDSSAAALSSLYDLFTSQPDACSGKKTLIDDGSTGSEGAVEGVSKDGMEDVEASIPGRSSKRRKTKRTV